MKIKEVLLKAYEAKASDIHMMADSPVMIRADGELRPLEESNVEAADMEEVLQAFLTKSKRERLDREGEVNLAVTISGFLRLRINLYRQRGTYAAAFHMMPLDIPAPEELEIPPAVIALAKERKGLVLITGEAGSGTTTTVASLLNRIAQQESKHIITIESPVEYLISNGKGIVSQREVGSDTREHARALKAAMRQDADVIFISELPDADTVMEALKAAESGRLVISSMPTGQAVHTLQRLIELFPSDMRDLARMQLANVLKGVVWQQLLPRCDKGGRNAVFEVLLADQDIRALIRGERMHQIFSAIEDKRERGMQSMDDAILDAYMKSKIKAETAAAYAVDEKRMRQWMQIY